MACDKPNGDCTNVSPCGNTGCADEVPAPTLPRCQDVSLVAGVYPRATVTVNHNGCISAVTSGEFEVYTPDECCTGTGGGGEPPAGARGPQGDPGLAASIAVDPVIDYGISGSNWTVVNNGTPSAALLKFTAPPAEDTDGFPDYGYTGNVGGASTGFVFQRGLATSVPSNFVSGIEVEKVGNRANDFTFTVAPVSPSAPNRWKISLGIDQAFSSGQADLLALTSRVDALEATVNAAPTTAYLVASISGVNIPDPAGVVYPSFKVAGFPNTWQVDPALAGQTMTGSLGTTGILSATGRLALATGEYPVSIS